MSQSLNWQSEISSSNDNGGGEDSGAAEGVGLRTGEIPATSFAGVMWRNLKDGSILHCWKLET
ncbi:hypothetical protein Bca4012_076401 [Brassica carinata]|uniref:BnaCnng21900D protein n=3 Tax=Brassica TaxID=3705 RepID=A0A078IRM4_BRANA|nr:BnaCnng21900D [Brassica napus]VDD36022.1 unnamed protein product [Brassica oleracea]